MPPGPFVVGHLGEGEFGLIAFVAAMGLGVAWAVRRMRAVTSGGAGAETRRRDRTRDLCLVAGVLALAAAVSDPMDRYSARLFWVHMAQHVVLLTVAAPLIALGAPWRFLPGRVREWWSERFGAGTSGPMIAPAVVAAWLAFNVAFLAFHVPALYDATLTHLWVHLVEHAVFLGTAVWFWAVVFDIAAFRSAQADLWRAGYVLAAAGAGWLLAIVLTFAREPLYAEYARLGSRPGGISAMADQQLAAGVMLVPGSITFLLVAGLALARWLGTEVSDPNPPSTKSLEELRS